MKKKENIEYEHIKKFEKNEPNDEKRLKIEILTIK